MPMSETHVFRASRARPNEAERVLRHEVARALRGYVDRVETFWQGRGTRQQDARSMNACEGRIREEPEIQSVGAGGSPFSAPRSGIADQPGRVRDSTTCGAIGASSF
jgi:hypothetical protein